MGRFTGGTTTAGQGVSVIDTIATTPTEQLNEGLRQGNSSILDEVLAANPEYADARVSELEAPLAQYNQALDEFTQVDSNPQSTDEQIMAADERLGEAEGIVQNMLDSAGVESIAMGNHRNPAIVQKARDIMEYHSQYPNDTETVGMVYELVDDLKYDAQATQDMFSGSQQPAAKTPVVESLEKRDAISTFDGVPSSAEAAPVQAPNPVQSLDFSQLSPDELKFAVEEGLTAQDVFDKERARNVIPDLRSRMMDKERIDTYNRKRRDTTVSLEDGGIFNRARSMAVDIETGNLKLSTQLTPEAFANLKMGQPAVDPNSVTVPSILTKMGAQINSVNEKGRQQSTYDPRFWPVASVVTENYLADAMQGEGQDVDMIQKNVGPDADILTEDQSHSTVMTKAQGNAQLGKKIHREFQRSKNAAEGKPLDQYPEISNEEATILGDMAKEMWARSNPDMIRRVNDGVNKQVYYQLTPEGSDKIAKGAYARKKMFPKQNIRPGTAPTPKGRLVGEKGKEARRISGQVGKPTEAEKGQRKHDAMYDKAAENLNSVPNIVEKQRARILVATAIPALIHADASPLNVMFQEINNIGPSKKYKFDAAFAAKVKDYMATTGRAPGEGAIDYNPVEEMENLKDGLAQALYGIALERNHANHLTYYRMAYNNRLAPQQSLFDPTSNKTVRFVTANATPVPIKKGTRQDRNIRQMYAMMLVKGADMKMPDERERMLRRAEPQLIKWGMRLKAALDASVSHEQAEAVMDAIEKGIPLSDPSFPQVTGLALDPEADADLIKAIQDKGEDGPHFIDGLIDYVDYYDKVQRKGLTHHSFFNAYIDGKTNGLAANGIQMGSREVAFATGVMRSQDVDLLDDGDIRDHLKAVLLDGLEINGIAGVDEAISAPMYDIARAVFSHRDMNKKTTMTFGYGQDLEAFSEVIANTIGELFQMAKSNDPALIKKYDLSTFQESMQQLRQHVGEGHDLERYLGATLLGTYSSGLYEVLSPEGIRARALQKGAAMVHALAGKPFKFKTFSGAEIILGGNVTAGIESSQTYKIGDTTMTAQVYGTRATAAAPKMVGGEAHIGRKAVGGAVPAPVQSLDAETVALSVTGKSWDRLTKASNGNPYIHTVYDAFKMDANGYDVVLEEVNRNWLMAAMKWSYLQEFYDATKATVKETDAHLKELGETPVDVTPNGEYAMVGNMLLQQETKRGTMFAVNMMRGLKQAIAKDQNESSEAYDKKIFDRVNYFMGRYGEYSGADTIPADVVRDFFSDFIRLTNLSAEMKDMIALTERKKKELAKEIRKSGQAVYQYFAH